MSPLPFTAPEFQAMPKAWCMSCREYVPLQLLGLHVSTCTKSTGNDEASSDNDIVNLDDLDFDEVDDEKLNSVILPVCTNNKVTDMTNKVACPLCCQLFTNDDILVHASVCGESDTKDAHVRDCEDTSEHYNSVSDILMSLRKKVDTTKTFNITVTRQDLFQRGIKQWSRQKQASPKNLLSVSFIGEDEIDQGALRKEFLTEMVRAIESQFFEGNEETGKNPKYSMLDYQDCNFKYVYY
ncbi:uncharacterized protein LOC121649125 [Melanotaenia boesemani]|uniref:uncharacterized protein LOC121649125 n=1 Tax=Melanotaenia boesemani TaxID=1250792 RepID=UPI001C04DF0E|nr:uncharacterized protein LOC121649125 [Melanotaenia boesemani]